ncbi:MAG: hypothetical protein AAFU64_10620, partial [Bacteroidota bacterium]
MKYIFISLFIFFAAAGCQERPEVVLSDEVPPIEKEREVKILSGFFGLDNALPPRSVVLSPKAPGNDGMPIIFSHELDPATLQASDFKVKTFQGDIFEVAAATLLPASEAF